jgi:hypothetical protein
VVFARIVPCEPSAPGCADQFLSTFGERAFRRPLAEDELGTFRALFDLGGELVQSGDAFRDGLRLSVEAFLQAPQFLYRTEASLEAGAGGRLALSDWEVASRLSYVMGVQSDGFGLPEGMGGATTLGDVYSRLLV